MVLRVGVSCVGSNHVTNPAEGSAATNPEPWGNDQPEYARQYAPVVELAYSGNDKTQHTSQEWIAHRLLTSLENSYDRAPEFVRWNETQILVSADYCSPSPRRTSTISPRNVRSICWTIGLFSADSRKRCFSFRSSSCLEVGSFCSVGSLMTMRTLISLPVN